MNPAAMLKLFSGAVRRHVAAMAEIAADSHLIGPPDPFPALAALYEMEEERHGLPLGFLGAVDWVWPMPVELIQGLASGTPAAVEAVRDHVAGRGAFLSAARKERGGLVPALIELAATASGGSSSAHRKEVWDVVSVWQVRSGRLIGEGTAREIARAFGG